MKITHCLSLSAALLLLAGSANAQNFNIDVGDTFSVGHPTSAYGAGAHQNGFWNPVSGGMPYQFTLLDLNQRFAGAITQMVADLVPPGHDAKLLASAIMLAFDANLLLSFFDPSPRGMDERSAAVAELTSLVRKLADPPVRG